MTDPNARLPQLNVAHRLTAMAARIPDNIAIAEPMKHRGKPQRNPYGKRMWRVVTFRELDRDSNRIAQALIDAGVRRGMRIALMVPQSIDFITLVFALYKAGAVLILIDPGMGIKSVLQCLKEAQPDGFVAIPIVQAVRTLLRRRFPLARLNLTVGHRWFWGGLSLTKIRKRPFGPPVMAEVAGSDPAAIIFTSGSTGPAKGVLYTHQIFNTQVDEIRKRLGIEPGEIDLAGFPFFGLFNAAMGTTAVLPDMDSTKPASVDPQMFLEVAADWKITQSFGSPALWHRVVDYCITHNKKIETLRRAISAGAPVPVSLLERFQQCIADDGEIYTPYGATEALPVAVISAREVIDETANKTACGGGICVGKKFDQIEWKIIPITDKPIEKLEETQSLPTGVIGELVVTGPQVTPCYVTRVEANQTAKIWDSHGRIWHRMGDVGYLDEAERFWFCGRKSHRVETATGTLFSIPCEAIANGHPHIFRSALIGRSVGQHGADSLCKPVMVVEPLGEKYPENSVEKELLIKEILERLGSSPLTKSIQKVIVAAKSFPVDVRHNAKINRELLAKMLREGNLR